MNYNLHNFLLIFTLLISGCSNNKGTLEQSFVEIDFDRVQRISVTSYDTLQLCKRRVMYSKDFIAILNEVRSAKFIGGLKFGANYEISFITKENKELNFYVLNNKIRFRGQIFKAEKLSSILFNHCVKK